MISLIHLVLLILIPTIFFRSLVLISGARKFIKIFEGAKHAAEGRRLVESLEIPGLKSFVRTEIVIGTLPYFVLSLLILQNDYVDLTYAEQDLTLLLMTFFVFAIWVTFDLIKSYSIHRELSKLADDTNRLKKISGNALEGLRFVIHRKGIIKRTAVKYTVGLFKNRLLKKQKEKKSFLRKVSISSLGVVEKITSFPERVSKSITEWIKEDLDERLMKRFEKYSNRSYSSVAFGICWSLIPAGWILLLNHIV